MKVQIGYGDPHDTQSSDSKERVKKICIANKNGDNIKINDYSFQNSNEKSPQNKSSNREFYGKFHSKKIDRISPP